MIASGAAHKTIAQFVCALLYQTQQEVYQELYQNAGTAKEMTG
jgi:hypothetical protein